MHGGGRIQGHTNLNLAGDHSCSYIGCHKYVFVVHLHPDASLRVL